MPRPTLRSSILALGLALACGACGESGGDPGDGLYSGGPEGPDAPEDITYGQRVYVLAIGETTTPQTPTVTNEVLLWSISPALPQGMSFNTSTGEISGTPGVYTRRTTHEVVGLNADGADETLLVVQVGGEARFAFAGSTSDGSIAQFALELGSGHLLHRGWVGGVSGGIDDLDIDGEGSVLCAVSDSDLQSWQVDSASGQLTLVDTLALGSGSHSLALSASGDFVYVTTEQLDRLQAYSIEAITGALTLVGSVTTAFKPEEVTIDPQGRFLIVRHVFNPPGNANKTPMRSFKLDPSTGGMTLSAGIDIFADVQTLEFGSLGETLYMLLDLPADTVLPCTVDTSTGDITLGTGVGTGTSPAALSVAPDGRRLYVANLGSSDISMYDINATDGSLSAPVSLPVSSGKDGLSFSFDGDELYAVDSGAREVSALKVDSGTGQFDDRLSIFTRLGSLPLAHVSGPAGISERGTDLYVLNQGSGDVAAYSIDALTGDLDDGGNAPALAGATPEDMAVDPRGRFLYVSHPATNEILGFDIQADGTLMAQVTPTDLGAGLPTKMGVDSSGRFLFVTVGLHDLLVAYEIQADGTLIVASSVPMPDNPTSVVVDPSGQFVYVTIGGNGTTMLGEVRITHIGGVSGALTALPAILSPGYPSSLGFGGGGARAYVTLRDGDSAQTFDVQPAGALIPVGPGSLTLSMPRGVELTHGGRFGYVVYEDTAAQGGLLLYDVHDTTGELYDSGTLALQWRAAVAAGTGARALLLSPDDLHIYVLARTSEEILVYDADEETGLTTLRQTQGSGMLPVQLGTVVIVE